MMIVGVHVEMVTMMMMMMMMMMMLVEAKMMNIDFVLISCITSDYRYVSSTHPQSTIDIYHHRPIGEGPL